MNIRYLTAACILAACLALTPFPGAAAGENFRKEGLLLPAGKHDARYIECIRKADYSLEVFRFDEAIRYCETALRYEGDDYLARAVMCLAYYEIAEQLSVNNPDDRRKKIALYGKMVDLAEEGIRCAPDRGECYFMRGLAHARLSTTRGIVYSLFRAKGIKRDWEKALRSQSEYRTPNGEDLRGSSYVALGMFYRLCPSSPLLKLLFGVNGDIDQSVAYCQKACETDPAHIMYAKEYGVSLITRGLKKDRPEDVEKGKEMLRRVATLPLRFSTDKVDRVHSEMLLNNPSLCPGYSRDQQQDISEKAVRKAKKYSKWEKGDQACK